MVQLRQDILSGAWATWAGVSVPGLSRKWPSRFPVSVKCATGTAVGQLAENATGSLLVTAAEGGAVLARVPACTKVGSGADTYYKFLLDLDSGPIAALFNSDAARETIAAKIEVRFQNGDSSEVSSSLPFEIQRADGRGTEVTPLPATVTAQGFSVRLGAGVGSGHLDFSPRMLAAPVVTLTLVCPPGAPVLTVSVIGDPTEDGFDFELSGDTPNGDYSLIVSAVVAGATATRQSGIFDIPDGVDTFEIPFDPLMTAPPIVRGFTIITPAGSSPLLGVPLGAPTASKLTGFLLSPTTNGNYRCHYDVEVPS